MLKKLLWIVTLSIISATGADTQQWSSWEQVFEGYIEGEYVAGCYNRRIGSGYART